jgi:hypothetical protein
MSNPQDESPDPEWISEKMFGEIPDDDLIIFLPQNDEEPF